MTWRTAGTATLLPSRALSRFQLTAAAGGVARFHVP
jgi:hypothetical protein